MVADLSEYLGSPAPELRDDIAYIAPTSWIYRQKIVPIDLRRRLLDDWARERPGKSAIVVQGRRL